MQATSTLDSPATGTLDSPALVPKTIEQPVSSARIKSAKSGVTHSAQTVCNTKGTRAHTHRELIRKWLWEPKGSSLEYI